MSKPTSLAVRRQRYAAQRMPVLIKENRELRKEVERVRAEVYVRASSETLVAVYDSIRDLGGLAGAQWLSQRLMAAREKRKPTRLDPQIERLVIHEIAEHLKKCGQRSYLRELQRSHGARLGVVL